jgi:olefin beta-lactone synthetase
MSNIVNYFLEQAKQNPNKIAIIHQQKSITFLELKIAVINRAAYLQSKGINQGDRLLVFVPMSISLYINVLAIFYIGAIAVFVDDYTSIKKLSDRCNVVNCKGIIASRLLLFIGLFIKAIRVIPIHLNSNAHLNNTSINPCNVQEQDTALLTFTTGSTGIPKATVRTHKQLQAQFQALLPLLNPDAERIDMPLLPIVLLLNLGIGRTSVIAKFNTNKSATKQAALLHQLIKEHKVKSITSSPYTLQALATYYCNNNIVSTLQKVIIGGAPVFPNLAKQLYNYIATDITIVYGSTEAEPMAHTYAYDLLNEHASLQNGLYVGKVDLNTNLKIIPFVNEPISTEQFTSLATLQNTPGEIIVQGQHVLNKYYNNHTAFVENKIIDAYGNIWHRTGDLGILQNKQLFLLGRCKQAFCYNNKWYYPFIIENILQQISGISIGTVMYIQKPIAVIETNSKISEVEILNTLAQINLTNVEIKYLTIPRDPRHNSKIDYNKLKSLLT